MLERKVVMLSETPIRPKARKVFTIVEKNYVRVLIQAMKEECIKVPDYQMIELNYKCRFIVEIVLTKAKIVRHINYVPIYQIGNISKILN